MSAFEELGVSPELIRACEGLGWTLPTPVQAEAVPLILGGGDVMVGACTRTNGVRMRTRTARARSGLPQYCESGQAHQAAGRADSTACAQRRRRAAARRARSSCPPSS
jgi:ATP-dependent RNA helicase DDX1